MKKVSEIQGRLFQVRPDGGPRAEFAVSGRVVDDTRLHPDAVRPARCLCVSVLIPTTLAMEVCKVLQNTCKAAQSRAVDILNEANLTVKLLVEERRSRGLENAFEVVGKDTGLTPRRIRSFWYGQVSAGAVTAYEIQAIRAAENDHMQRAIADAERRVEALRQRVGVSLPSRSFAGGVPLGAI